MNIYRVLNKFELTVVFANLTVDLQAVQDFHRIKTNILLYCDIFEISLNSIVSFKLDDYIIILTVSSYHFNVIS